MKNNLFYGENQKMLNAQRRKELKTMYPNSKAIGKAFVQSYLERRKNHKDPIFKTTLTLEEVNYLKNRIKILKDKDLFQPYYSLYRLLRQFVRWTENYEHVFYHGLFRALALIQAPDYDIRIYHLLKSQNTIDEDAIEEAKSQYDQSLVPVVETLIPNWNDLMALALKKLYSYSLRLEKIQELTKYNLEPLFPNIEHHENEVKTLQRIATSFRENLDQFITINSFDVNDEVLKALDNFIQFNVDTLKPTGEEREKNIQQVIETIDAIKEVIE